MTHASRQPARETPLLNLSDGFGSQLENPCNELEDEFIERDDEKGEG